MKTIKEINKAFDDKFAIKTTQGIRSGEGYVKSYSKEIKSFWNQQILSLIEELEGKNNNKYIFMLCPFCGKMGIVKRSEEDPKEAVWCKNPCGCNSEKVEGEIYYSEDGFINLFKELL